MRSLHRHARSLRFAGVLALGLAVGTAYTHGVIAQFLTAAEQFLADHGFGFEQVTLSGHRHTPDGDIFEALGAGARTLFSFDTEAAKTRIEALPWIERVTLRRTFPNTLDLAVVERQAVIVWQTDQATTLLDRQGRHLGALPRGHSGQGYGTGLVVLTGATADKHAAEALALVGKYPGLTHRLRKLEHVAGRRWTIHLANGRRIHLPAEDAERALLIALDLERRDQLAGVHDVDLRVAGRVVLLGGDAPVTDPMPLKPDATTILPRLNRPPTSKSPTG